MDIHGSATLSGSSAILPFDETNNPFFEVEEVVDFFNVVESLGATLSIRETIICQIRTRK